MTLSFFFSLQFQTVEKLIPNNCFCERLLFFFPLLSFPLPALDKDFSSHTLFIAAIILPKSLWVLSKWKQWRAKAERCYHVKLGAVETWVSHTRLQMLDKRLCFQPKDSVYMCRSKPIRAHIQAHSCTRRPGWGLWEILLYHALPYCFGAGSLTKSAVQHF